MIVPYLKDQEVVEKISFKKNISSVTYGLIMIFFFGCNSYKNEVPQKKSITPSFKLDEDKVYKVVEEMPRFPGCEKEVDKRERKECAQKKLLKFLHGKIKFPEEAKENLIFGKIVIEFIVNKKGAIENIKMLKDPGGIYENEIKRVLGLMPEWIPGQHKGKPVKVEIRIPMYLHPE